MSNAEAVWGVSGKGKKGKGREGRGGGERQRRTVEVEDGEEGGVPGDDGAAVRGRVPARADGPDALFGYRASCVQEVRVSGARGGEERRGAGRTRHDEEALGERPECEQVERDAAPERPEDRDSVVEVR